MAYYPGITKCSTFTTEFKNNYFNFAEAGHREDRGAHVRDTSEEEYAGDA
jgi:hypothetical protein